MGYLRTPEHRARQAALIRAWQPWEHSTGPKSPAGKAAAAANAFTGGHGAKLRELQRAMNELLREQRGMEVEGMRLTPRLSGVAALQLTPQGRAEVSERELLQST